MPAGQFADPIEAMVFIQSGNSHFTLRSKATETRYTYHVEETTDGKAFWVSVLYGPDNTGDYVYAGLIKNGVPVRTKRSRLGSLDKRWVAFCWAYGKLSAHIMPDALEVWHEGRCGRCARMLTVPESIRDGIGPECRKKSRIRCVADGVAGALK
jgi:hypothetical protein